jgi:hypothetical protein
MVRMAPYDKKPNRRYNPSLDGLAAQICCLRLCHLGSSASWKIV